MCVPHRICVSAHTHMHTLRCAPIGKSDMQGPMRAPYPPCPCTPSMPRHTWPMSACISMHLLPLCTSLTHGVDALCDAHMSSGTYAPICASKPVHACHLCEYVDMARHGTHAHSQPECDQITRANSIQWNCSTRKCSVLMPAPTPMYKTAICICARDDSSPVHAARLTLRYRMARAQSRTASTARPMADARTRILVHQVGTTCVCTCPHVFLHPLQHTVPDPTWGPTSPCRPHKMHHWQHVWTVQDLCDRNPECCPRLQP